MKRKLKITYGQLEATQERVAVFRNALENMDSAIEMFQNILSEQQSDAITALLEDGRDLRDEMELLHGNLQELENMLSGYIQDMTALVMPKSWDSMMLVDRNDIWVNMKQIKSNVSDTEQVIWGGALQHYKDVHTNIPKPHISSSMTEPEKRSAREEYDRKVRERAQREENYKKLKAFTETQAKQAKQELEECYKEIEDLYRNRIVVYENTDDEYKKTAMDLYQQCTSFGQRLKDLVTKTEEMKWDVRRGVLAAVLDLVKTALAIQDLKNTLDTLPFAVVAEVMGIEVPGLSLEKVDDLKNMAYGAVAALQEPPRVLAAFGQKIGDTVEEEGIAYSISYVAADVAIQVLLSKGLSEVKNVSKADDLVDVARTVDTLDDTVKIADELTDAAKVVDQVGDIADAAMAVNVMDETNAAVKAVDEVNDVADAVKTVEKLDGVIEGGSDAFQIGKTDLDALRNKLGVPETDTIAVGKTDVKGLEGVTFEGQSPKVRSEAGLPDLDEIWAGRNIKSPGNNTLFTRHAEEVLANDFDRAGIEAGINPQDVSGVLKIHQSNPTGVCRKCIQGLANDNVSPGVLKQLSLKYPNLRIEVTSEILPDVKVTGKSNFVIQNGQYVE